MKARCYNAIFTEIWSLYPKCVQWGGSFFSRPSLHTQYYCQGSAYTKDREWGFCHVKCVFYPSSGFYLHIKMSLTFPCWRIFFYLKNAILTNYFFPMVTMFIQEGRSQATNASMPAACPRSCESVPPAWPASAWMSLPTVDPRVISLSSAGGTAAGKNNHSRLQRTGRIRWPSAVSGSLVSCYC